MSNRRTLIVVAMFLGACATPATVPPTLVLETGTINRNTVAFSADAALLGPFPSMGTDLASGAVNGELTLWSLPEGKHVHAWRAHAGSVHGLAFVTGDRVVSGSYDASIALWSSDGTLRLRRVTPAPIVDRVVYEPADPIVTGHRDGAVRRWRLSDLVPLSETRLHRGGVRAVGYHPNGLYASSGHDGAIYVWRLNEAPRALKASPTDPRDLIFSPDGRFLYGSGWFKVFRWDVANGALAILPTEHHGIIVSLDLSADGRRLASISRETDSAVQLLDPTTGTTLVRFQSHELCGAHVRLSPDGRYLASTSADATVRVWNLGLLSASP